MLRSRPRLDLGNADGGAGDFLRIPRILRADVLHAVTRIAGRVGVPLAALFTFLTWRAGRPVLWQSLVLLALIVVSQAKRLAPRGSVRQARRVAVWWLGFAVLFATLQAGPTFVNGVFYLTWLFAFIFFERHWLLASTLGAASILALGFFVTQGYVDTSWASEGPRMSGWAFMALNAGAISLSASFMFDRVLESLEASLRSEIEARTAEAQAQADREAALSALAANQRIESLGRLAGGVAHDFNNALGVLTLGLDSLEVDANAAERAQSLEIMQRALRGARETTRQLLSFSRQGSAPGSGSHAAEVISGMASSLTRLFPATMRIVTEVRTAGRVGLGVGELEQALLNLCLNARDAMHGEGTLILRTLPADHDAGMLVIEVEDTGSGMTEEVRRRALDPFFTTKEAEGSTGLGLAMVHASAGRAGGSVEIMSTPGRGTTVRLVLPLAGEPVTPVVAEPPSISAPRARRILYVEDEPSLVRMTARALGRAGHEVAIATTAAEGLARLASDPLPDLLLTDARLPDGSCAPVIREFRRRRPRAPVILCSGYVEDEAVVDGIERATIVFLQKPYGIKVLLDAVDRVLGAPPLPVEQGTSR